MRNLRIRTNRRRNGFTLIELLLVLMILVLLATLVVPRFVGQSADAKVKASVAQIGMFKTALNMFNTNVGRFPTTEEGLNALIEQPSDASGWKGPYLDSRKLPKDPWGNQYQYAYPASHSNDYDLWSNGPDKQSGTQDDVTNWSDE